MLAPIFPEFSRARSSRHRAQSPPCTRLPPNRYLLWCLKFPTCPSSSRPWPSWPSSPFSTPVHSTLGDRMSDVDPATVDQRAVRNLPPARWQYWPKPTPQTNGRSGQHFIDRPYAHVRELPGAPEGARAYCNVCRRFFVQDGAHFSHRDYRRSTLTECVPLPPRRPRETRSAKPHR